MRIHYLQHVPFEGPAAVERWAGLRGHELAATTLYGNPGFPDLRDFGMLVVLGGPMNVYEEETYPWLRDEKAFIRDAIEAGKTVVGVCLGAQLIADVLGAKVFHGPHREIGWFPVELTPAARRSEIFGFLPARFTAFHWHGDTFDIPEHALHLAYSEGCRNQAFILDGRVLGLQFHLESTPESVRDIVENSGREMKPAPFVQNGAAMLSATDEDYRRLHDALFGVLDRLP